MRRREVDAADAERLMESRRSSAPGRAPSATLFLFFRLNRPRPPFAALPHWQHVLKIQLRRCADHRRTRRSPAPIPPPDALQVSNLENNPFKSVVSRIILHFRLAFDNRAGMWIERGVDTVFECSLADFVQDSERGSLPFAGLRVSGSRSGIELALSTIIRSTIRTRHTRRRRSSLACSSDVSGFSPFPLAIEECRRPDSSRSHLKRPYERLRSCFCIWGSLAPTHEYRSAPPF